MSSSRNMGGRPAKHRQLINTSLGIMGFMVTDLFKAIKKRPTVYNFSLDDADDGQVRMRRHAQWDEIAQEVFPNYKKLPENEQQTVVLPRLKGSWKGHRSLFLKSIRMKEEGDPRYKPYIFSKELDFFLNFKCPKMDRSGYTNHDDQSNDAHRPENEACSPKKRKMQEIHNVKKEINDSFVEEGANSKRRKVSAGEVSEVTTNNTSTPYSSERLRQRNANANCSYTRKSATKSKKVLKLHNSETEVNRNESVFDPMQFCQTTVNRSITRDESPQLEDNRFEPTTDRPMNATPLVQIHTNVGESHNSFESNMQTNTIDGSINQIEQQHGEMYTVASSSQEKSTGDDRCFPKQHTESQVCDDNADYAFFESIKPCIRKIRESEKLDFKIEFLQLLKKYQSN